MLEEFLLSAYHLYIKGKASFPNTVYLTFDDGPHVKSTPVLLNLLSNYGIKATFFVIGRNAESYPNLLQQIQKEGHLLGNHTYSHLRGANTPFKVYIDDVIKCFKIVKTRIFRPPYASVTLRQYYTLRKMFHIFFWTWDSKDYQQKINTKKVQLPAIMLFHDYPGALHFSIPFLNNFIREAQANKVRFAKLDELIK